MKEGGEGLQKEGDVVEMQWRFQDKKMVERKLEMNTAMDFTPVFSLVDLQGTC